MKARSPFTFACVMVLYALALLLSAGSPIGPISAALPPAQASVTISPAALAYLPLLRGRPLMPTNTPTPTSTPVAGCTTAPILLDPPDGAALDTLIPLFRWDFGNNPQATWFRIEVGLDQGLTQPVYWMRTWGLLRGISQWRIDINLDPATTYYWRAYLGCGDTQGPYSQVRSFTTGSGAQIPPAPALLSPTDGATLAGTSVTIRWAPVSATVEYELNYTRDYRNYYYIMVPGTETQTDVTSLRPNTTYEWWVRARNGYAWGAEPAHWHFTTGPSGSSASPGGPQAVVETFRAIQDVGRWWP